MKAVLLIHINCALCALKLVELDVYFQFPLHNCAELNRAGGWKLGDISADYSSFDLREISHMFGVHSIRSNPDQNLKEDKNVYEDRIRSSLKRVDNKGIKLTENDE